MQVAVSLRDAFLFLSSLLLSFAAGGINGLIGVGGGTVFFLISSLVGIGKREKKDSFSFAMLTTIPLSLLSLMLYKNISDGIPNPFMLTVTAAAGGLIGAVLRDRVKSEWLSYAFSLLTVFSGVRMLFT